MVGLFEAGTVGFADGVAAAFVFVVRGDITDGFVTVGPVVFDPYPFQLGGEDGGAGDGHEGGVDGRPKCWAIEQVARNRPNRIECHYWISVELVVNNSD